MPAYHKLADLDTPIAEQALDLSRNCIFLKEVLLGLLLFKDDQGHLCDIFGELQLFFLEVLILVIFDGLSEALFLLLLLLVIFVHFLRDQDVLYLKVPREFLVLLFQLSVSRCHHVYHVFFGSLRGQFIDENRVIRGSLDVEICLKLGLPESINDVLIDDDPNSSHKEDEIDLNRNAFGVQ